MNNLFARTFKLCREAQEKVMRQKHNAQLEEILHLVRAIHTKLNQQGVVIMATLADVRAAVEANTSVDGSAIALLQGLTAKIQELIDNGANPAELQALVDQLTADNQKLADAVVANTPAA